MDTPEPALLTGELSKLHALIETVARDRPAALVAALERSRARTDELVARIEEIDRALPDYASIPEEQIRQVVDAFLEMGIAALTGVQIPGGEEYRLVEELVRSRVEQGVSPGSFMLAVQLGVSAFLGVFDEEAQHVGVPAHEVLAVHDAVRDLTNLLVAALSTSYRRQETGGSRNLDRRRSAFLRSLALGRPDPAKLARTAGLIGLDPDASYYAISAPIIGGMVATRSREARRALVDATGGAAIATLLEDRVVALSPRPPSARPELALIGVAGPARLNALSAAFDEARGAADAAAELGLTGVVDYVTLGPLPLLVSAHAAADALDRHHYAALDAEGRIGQEIANTVASYLAQDHNVDAAAAELHVHRNTVHHRLRRFRELTALDIRRTEDLVLAWWLLRRRALLPAARENS